MPFLIKTRVRKIKSFYYTWRVKRVVATFREPLKVNGKSVVTNNTYLGKNVNLNGMRIVGGGVVRIGDNFHSGTECQMITEFHNYEGTEIPYDSIHVFKDIVIGDNVWVGNRVLILGGVTLGEGVIVQAGSVVVNDIPECSIVGGHPAKLFKYRNKDHYFNLKSQGKFH